ncbi:di/tricarboxylate transporter [Dongia mobilis]|uniref:Di/tricarboxylate transporter n=1 Tax=Dongia mobilis TaxID=578943 RepID=A0A4R6WFQ2_9PROT|nr:SLC13 family permease [Dongia mobilis]TDQ78896.1 di/tricarboxylate transporter [Dongia mobilis]
MTEDQVFILAILAAAAAMFLWGRWRHDMVALAALLAGVVAGVVPAADAFAGFAHPAVITVACVLVLSHGLQASGVIDILTERVLPEAAGPTLAIAAVTGLAAILSAFMNNVGALALLMPVALQMAARQNLPPGKVLMPLAFGSILGGMTTLIGTPPNLIVSSFRSGLGNASFSMFDFTPVGLAVAAAGLGFVALVGWRLVPARKGAGAEEFDTGAYLTEARVSDKAKAVGMTLREIERVLDEADAQIVGLVRREFRVTAPNPARKVQAGDILIIEAEPKALAAVLSTLNLTLEEAVTDQKGETEKAEGAAEAAALPEDILLREIAVLPNSVLAGRSASDIRLRSTYGINLLAISRQGQRSIARLRTMPIQPGDVLLMQGTPDAIADFAAQCGGVPLAERSLRLPDSRQAFIAAAIMLASVGSAAVGLLPAAISFAGGVLASMAFRTVSPRRVYDAVDWPVIVLLGALIPVAEAMATTGTADLIARLLLDGVARGHAIVALGLILVVTMTLSDFMNNAATAAVMCPIAIGTANSMGASADPFLMAVAVGASCAFLTPIGHQNNTLILGPGGFRFGDYWKLGLPLEVIVVAVALPMLLLVWPL